MDFLDDYVLNDLADFISQPEIKSMFKDGKAQRIPSSEQAKINEYKQRIATIDIDIQKLLDACLTSGDVAVKYLNERIDLLDTEKQNLQAEILAIQNKSNRKLELEGLDINSAPTALAGGEFDTKKYLCNFFIEQIIFYDRDNVQIRYKMWYRQCADPI